jgi:hypothetical protein
LILSEKPAAAVFSSTASRTAVEICRHILQDGTGLKGPRLYTHPATHIKDLTTPLVVLRLIEMPFPLLIIPRPCRGNDSKILKIGFIPYIR